MSTQAKPSAPFTSQELKDFLTGKKVVIVSQQQASARAVRKLVLDFGAKADKTLPCFTFEEAKKELEREPAHLLITDLSLGKKSGIELIRVQEKNFPNRLEVASIIMCGEPSRAESATLADSGADAVFLKPFNQEKLLAAFHQALSNKVNPSPYWKLLEKGKEHFHKEEYEQAFPLFEECKKLNPRPTLAWYYQGQIHRQKNELQNAVAAWKEGMALNQKDYPCLNAIFETFMLMKEFNQAYETAQVLHQTHPVSLARILDLVKLSVYQRKYDDILDYYTIFKQLESKDETVCRVVIAGMLVCAKYLYLNDHAAEAFAALKSAAKLSLDSNILSLETFRYFIETRNFKEAESHYGSLPLEIRKKPDCQLLNLQLVVKTRDASSVVQTASRMVESGFHDSRVYSLLIENSKKMGRSEAMIQKIVEEAKIRFPGAF